jgi:malate synthase
MEDAATAEICRAQIWQWARHGAKLSDGRPVTAEFVRSACVEQIEKLRQELGPDQFAQRRFRETAQIFEQMVTSQEFPEFLTLAAYNYID